MFKIVFAFLALAVLAAFFVFQGDSSVGAQIARVLFLALIIAVAIIFGMNRKT
ncbi:MAG: DUF1328 domain-containing protein [Verrucomicrobia bacterium]|nr:DUF1328 domain-containing protein [Verrucomicrobiota bacterium]MBS0636013.1 DUF1328 domain-containing protein [Verrucomicrobiota bacterium]